MSMQLGSAQRGMSFRLVAAGLAVLALSFSSGVKAQISFINMFRSGAYTQTNNGNSLSLTGFFFTTTLFSINPGDFTTATVTYPGPGSPAAMPLSSPTTFDLSSPFFADQAAMDLAYPMGTYLYNADGPAGPDSTSFDYSADHYPQSLPFLD